MAMKAHQSAWRRGLPLAAALLIAPAFAAAAAGEPPPKPAAAAKKGVKGKARPAKPAKAAKAAPKAGSAGEKKAAAPKAGQLADFGQANASPEVQHVANWVSYTRNNQKKAFVVIDKKMARMYVFDPRGKLKSDAPVLLGSARGDHSAPGVGNKPLSQLAPEEKTTPAGRFLARPGRNLHTDVIWIDYNAAVSLHRVLKVGDERRHERLASPGIGDNRVSNGCVNVPVPFYNSVLKPTVMKYGAYVYVLPETRTPQQLFGSYDVSNKAVQVAQGPQSAAK
jgi:hypothetical protein